MAAVGLRSTQGHLKLSAHYACGRTRRLPATRVGGHHACEGTPCVWEDTMRVGGHHAFRRTPCVWEDTMRVGGHHACEGTPCVWEDIIMRLGGHHACGRTPCLWEDTMRVGGHHACGRTPCVWEDTRRFPAARRPLDTCAHKQRRFTTAIACVCLKHARACPFHACA